MHGCCCPLSVCACTNLTPQALSCVASAAAKRAQSLPANTTSTATIAPPSAAKPAQGGDDDYGAVLKLTYLFYEGQMSGKLPAWNRLLVGKPGGYKTSAHLNDGKDIEKDLSGGFYDAGGACAKRTQTHRGFVPACTSVKHVHLPLSEHI